jgi:hypothetical protein
MSLSRILAGALALCGAAGCSLVGLGRIQPRHVEGAWTFRTTGVPAGCGIDSLAVHLRDGDRTWGGFFLSGDARPDGHPGPPLRISHGRVNPDTGAFRLVFSDHESPPERTRQFALEGTFDESGGAAASYVRSLPGLECVVGMNGRRER